MQKPVPEIYRRLGVRPVIHGSGTTTRYGGSMLRPQVLETMREASQALVNLDELNEAAGAAIARMLGAEAAFVTAGASAGRTLRPGDGRRNENVDDARCAPFHRHFPFPLTPAALFGRLPDSRWTDRNPQ